MSLIFFTLTVLVCFISPTSNDGQLEVPQDCERAWTEILSAHKEGIASQPWRRMVEATGYPLEDILRGVQTWPGSYDDCLAISEAHYCISTFQADFESGPFRSWDTSNLIAGPLSVGVCVPKVCTVRDMQHILDRLLIAREKASSEKTTPSGLLSVLSSRCYSQAGEISRPITFYICLAFILALCALVVIATDFEHFYAGKPEASYASVLRCFSLRSNAAHLFSMTTNPEEILILNSVRGLSMVLIIYGHIWLFAKNKSNNLIDIFSAMGDTLFEKLLLTMEQHVDTFFVMGGLVASYQFFHARNRLFKWRTLISMAIHRYVRITPLYAFVIWTRSSLVDDILTRPLWFSHGLGLHNEADDCAVGFWKNLLYINNLNYTPQFCLAQSWYLASDMQLYLFSLVVFVPLSLKSSIKLSAILVLTSTVLIFVLSTFSGAYLVMKLHPMSTLLQRYFPYFVVIHIKPYCRFASYGMGLLLGTVLQTRETPAKLISKRFLSTITLLAFLCLMLPVATLYTFDLGETGFAAAFFTSLSRIVWSSGICLIIYASYTVQSSGMAIGRLHGMFLSALWSPLSKVSFAVYLVHLVFMNFYLGSLKNTIELSKISSISLFFFFLVTSLALGTLLYLLIERPAHRLWLIVLKRLSSDSTATESEKTQ